MVPTSRLICRTPADVIPGTMRAKRRLMPAVQRGGRRLKSIPARPLAIISKSTCARPAAATAQAMTWPAFPNPSPTAGSTKTSAAMNSTFRRTGAAAAAANR